SSNQGRVPRADRARTRHLLRNSPGKRLRRSHVSGPAALTLPDSFEQACDSAKGCRGPRWRSEWTALLPELSDRGEALLGRQDSHNGERPAGKTCSNRMCCLAPSRNFAVNSNRTMECKAEESGKASTHAGQCHAWRRKPFSINTWFISILADQYPINQYLI